MLGVPLSLLTGVIRGDSNYKKGVVNTINDLLSALDIYLISQFQRWAHNRTGQLISHWVLELHFKHVMFVCLFGLCSSNYNNGFLTLLAGLYGKI